MNNLTRLELEQLKRKQSHLERELAELSERLKRFESEFVAASETKPASVPPPLPPVIPARPQASDFPKQRPVTEAFATPRNVAPQPVEIKPPIAPPLYTAAPIKPPFIPPAQPSSAPEKRSFEMRLGTYWLVRVGIVMLLTGLVFFGNYAYQNFIGLLGPAGKVSLLYLASGILLGAGAWWQRRAAKESLKNYAQVLFAGGLAAVYFTTYAAHHIPNLRVIASSLLDGALLLGWAGFMVWMADRKKSEVLALFAIGLAYYTSVITRVGSFTLYSNLVLTVAAVFFLVRNRWAGLSLASLVATYASYGFWRFFDGSGWHWASPEEALWFGTYFLIGYWVIFTAAVFLSKDSKLSGANRAGFLTFNNGGFFTLFLLTMLQVNTGGFWKFSLFYGIALLALAELARRVWPSESLSKNSYLTQGLMLVTIGIISKFAGLQLALLLAAESVVLLTLGKARNSIVLQVGAYLAGAMAVGWGIDGLKRNDWRALALETAIGALMVFNACWSDRKAGDQPKRIRPVPAFFTTLALISWLATTWYNFSPENFPLTLALEAVALTLSVYVLRLREIALFGQSYLVLAQVAWLAHFIEPNVAPPWWNAVLLVAITIGLSHWWQRQKVLACDAQLSGLWQGLYALATVGVLYFWLNRLAGGPVWLALTSALAIALTVYGVFTRAWFLAACAQLFLIASVGQFALQLWHRKPEWFFPLAPLAALGFLSLATRTWFQRKPVSGEKAREPLLQLALIYRWVALLMSLWWVQEYIPARERVWFLMLLGFLAFLWGGWRKRLESLLASATFTIAGLAIFWLPWHGATTVYWPNLLALAGLLVQQRLATRWVEGFQLDARVQATMILLGGVSLWVLLSRWVLQSAGGFYLTASWSGLALILFSFGILWRERMYRWLGLGVLACALGRVVLFDVWKLETLYRILSFMALGVVLLALGFLYNKYQEKIREWL